MTAHPTRSLRSRLTAAPDDYEAAHRAVDEARQLVEALARKVAIREEGAAALHAAQYRLDGALKALHRTIGHGAPPAPPDPEEDPA